MKICWIFLLLLGVGCAQQKVTKTLTFEEQILLDTEESRGVFEQFQKGVLWSNLPEDDAFLNGLKRRILKDQTFFSPEKVSIRVYRMHSALPERVYGFPGTTVVIPKSYLDQVNTESELGASILFALAHVSVRSLSYQLSSLSEDQKKDLVSIFQFSEKMRKQAITETLRFMEVANLDYRGLVSFFQHDKTRLPAYGESLQWDIREASKMRSVLLPQKHPIVRTEAMIQYQGRKK